MYHSSTYRDMVITSETFRTVHFESPIEQPHISSTRKAFKAIGEITNKPFANLKAYYRKTESSHSGRSIRSIALRSDRTFAPSYRSNIVRPETQWISDAAASFSRPLKSCLKRGAASTLDNLFDTESLIDMSMEHQFIDSVWAPLNPLRKESTTLTVKRHSKPPSVADS